MNDTLWKIIGLLGTAMFSIRWIVQIIASRKAGKSIMTVHFWYLSAVGSFLLLLYFVFGKFDIIGVISNIFPLLIAGYNLFLDKKKQPVV